MSGKFKTALVALLMVCGASVTVAQSNQGVETIQKLVRKINGDIAKSEEESEHSNIYLTELAVNKGNGSYPAVGVYRPLVKFYYTYGDREKEPYPNRLLKIVVSVDRSSQLEYLEFVFNEAEQLIFYLEKKDEIERRIYFVSARAVRFEQGGKPLSPMAKQQAAIVATALKEKVKLVAIFRRSLEF